MVDSKRKQMRRGRRKKGDAKTPGSGRQKGTPNKVTLALKEAILAAFEEAGGVAYLKRVAQRDPRTFCMLLARVLPTEFKAEIDAAATLVVLRDYTGLHHEVSRRAEPTVAILPEGM